MSRSQGPPFGLLLAATVSRQDFPFNPPCKEPRSTNGNHAEDQRTDSMTLKILRTEDPRSVFTGPKPLSNYKNLEAPRTLLSSSTKTKKSAALGIDTRVLYLTPGVFCGGATPACLKACLGHTSGRMQLPSSAIARDRRTALYIARQDLFLKRLGAELTLFDAHTESLGTIPAVRLNGTSDLFWERRHRELFDQHPRVQFYDYTKIKARMRSFLNSSDWPENYHLTFSADSSDAQFVTQVLEAGGTAALVFWPLLPPTWNGFPVTDGDRHDARFTDRPGSLVGLIAKGNARVDLGGFVTRLCPQCPKEQPLTLVRTHLDTHRSTLHRCDTCTLGKTPTARATQHTLAFKQNERLLLRTKLGYFSITGNYFLESPICFHDYTNNLRSNRAHGRLSARLHAT